MVHKKNSQRSKGKPRGRPFAKGNNQGKRFSRVLASTGHENSNGRGSIAPSSNESILKPLEQEINPMSKKESNKNIGSMKKGEKSQVTDVIIYPDPTPEKYSADVLENDDKKIEESKIVESLVFTQGNNHLKICLIQKHNRMFRVQIFLNETTEIRPVSYTGSSTAMSFWNLLKKSMNQ